MKKIIMTIVALGMSCVGFAQQTQVLKDSLNDVLRKLETQPTSVVLMLKKAAFNMQLNQWENAIDTYSDVLQLDKNNPSALYYRAYAYERVHNYVASKVDYETLLSVNPLHFHARLGLVLLYQATKQTIEAFNLINQLIESNPQNAMVYAVRGGIEKEQNQWELALFDYSEALKYEPNNTDYRFNRIECLLSLNKKKEALDYLNYLIMQKVQTDMLAYWYKKCREK